MASEGVPAQRFQSVRTVKSVLDYWLCWMYKGPLVS